MATEAAIGRRRAEAVQRIEERCAALGGGQRLELPKFSRHGSDMLLVVQLETIADFLEQVQTAPSSEYESLSNRELLARIAERNLDKGKARSKPELIAVLIKADEAAEKAGV